MLRNGVRHWVLQGAEVVGVGVDDRERRGSSLLVNGSVRAFGMEGETDLSGRRLRAAA